MKFIEFFRLTRPNMDPPERLLCYDPGETTGFAIFEYGELIHSSQLDTHTIKSGIRTLLRTLYNIDGSIYASPKSKVTQIVYENYKVYNWKTDSHAWSNLHTPKLIGALEALAHMKLMPTYTQMAQQPKGFCTDKKLEEWGYYKAGLKHARDAIRHGCYYMLFNYMKDTK